MLKNIVAVTGAAGRVGVNVVQRLLQAGYDVHALVHSPLPAEHPLSQECDTLTVLDLAALPEQDIVNWLRKTQPIAFIHSAGLADVPGCERQPSLAYLLNAQVTRMLARICARQQTHFIMLSTEYVFGGTPHPEILYHEEDPVHPLNHYGKSKVQGELATQEECDQKTLWTICRTSMVYSQDYAPTQWHRPDFTQWVRSVLRQNQTLNIASDQVNSPIYSLDLAKILVAVVEQKLQGIYHVAGSTPISRYNFALEVARHASLDETLIQPALTSELDQNLQRPLNAGLCVDKISRSSAIRPLSIEEGLTLCQHRSGLS
jgi:dTDP-4-dehydrorhamnose reductase